MYSKVEGRQKKRNREKTSRKTDQKSIHAINEMKYVVNRKVKKQEKKHYLSLMPPTINFLREDGWRRTERIYKWIVTSVTINQSVITKAC